MIMRNELDFATIGCGFYINVNTLNRNVEVDLQGFSNNTEKSLTRYYNFFDHDILPELPEMEEDKNKAVENLKQELQARLAKAVANFDNEVKQIFKDLDIEE